MATKRKSPVAKSLLKNGCAAMIAGVEIHNKPLFDYRYEVVTLLVINAWELVLKAYIYRKSKKDVFDEEGQSKSLKKCLAYVLSSIGKDFLVVHESISQLYKYRNKVSHFHSEELDGLLFSLLQVNILLFVQFTKEHFNHDVIKGDLVLLPVSFSADFNPIEFLIKQPIGTNASKEVRDFVNGLVSSCRHLEDAGVTDSILSSWKVHLLSVKQMKNADILAARGNTAADATPVQLVNTLSEVNITNSPNATEIRLSDPEFFSLYTDEYKDVCENAKSMFRDLKVNAKFLAIIKSIKGNPNYHGERYLGRNETGSKRDWYSKLIYDELAKYYSRK